jgi:hypothetical protein
LEELVGEYGGKVSWIQDLALDLFSSFMLDLAAQDEARLIKFLEGGAEQVDILSAILVKHNICDTIPLARVAIVPALIARGIPLPEPPLFF